MLELTRGQVLAHRRRAGGLDERLPFGADSLRRAAWVGLQDSGPRAALLSIHARVAGTTSSTWEHPALAQVWGPGFSDYVVPAEDAALFTISRMPADEKKRRYAVDRADLLEAFLDGRRMPYGQAGHEMGVAPNSLRYGTTTGRLRIRWEGARAPLVWTVPPPEITPQAARLELARRYLHVYGPSTSAAFLRWAGIRSPRANAEFEGLAAELTAVSTPIGEAWILTDDESSFRAPTGPAAPARLLPSGDPYFLLWAADRELLIPNALWRPSLWTPRVWPGAVLVEGEVVGTWRRANQKVDISPWRDLSSAARVAIESEAHSFPLPVYEGRVVVKWLP